MSNSEKKMCEHELAGREVQMRVEILNAIMSASAKNHVVDISCLLGAAGELAGSLTPKMVSDAIHELALLSAKRALESGTGSEWFDGLRDDLKSNTVIFSPVMEALIALLQVVEAVSEPVSDLVERLSDIGDGLKGDNNDANSSDYCRN